MPWAKSKTDAGTIVRRRGLEFVVGGFTDPDGSREGVGSILVGYYDGRALRFAGKVGTGRGWNDAFGRKLRGLLESVEVDATPFDAPPPGSVAKRAHWVEPRLVAEVASGYGRRTWRTGKASEARSSIGSSLAICIPDSSTADPSFTAKR